jgi:hypothetical protein
VQALARALVRYNMYGDGVSDATDEAGFSERAATARRFISILTRSLMGIPMRN